MEFPRTVDEITAVWLTAVLRESGTITDDPIESFNATKIGGDQGIVGDVYRLELGYASATQGAPNSVVIKFANPDEQRREVSNAMSMYEREAGYYKHFAANSGMASPTCYYTSFDEPSGFMCLLIADLGHLRVVDQSDDLSLGDTRNALNELSKMHGRWWNDERLENYPWLNLGTNPESLDAFVERYNDSLETSLETVSEWLPNGFERVARRCAPVLKQLRESQNLAVPTLTHGDFRLGNLMFDDSATAEAPVIAFDWQMTSAASPASDVSYFVSWSLGTENRRRHEKELLDGYHDRLVEYGASGYSRTEFDDDLRRHLFKIVFTAIIATPNAGAMFATEEGRIRIKTMCERLQTVMDWNIEEVIPN